MGEKSVPRLTADQVISVLRRNGFVRVASGRRLVVLHAFVKKTVKTPRSAIRLALERAKEVL